MFFKVLKKQRQEDLVSRCSGEYQLSVTVLLFFMVTFMVIVILCMQMAFTGA